MKVTNKDWARFKYFQRHENWGDPDMMDLGLLEELEEFRYTIGYPIIVSCGTQGKHAPKSLHYTGEAADIIVDCEREKLPDIFLIANKFGFNGIGLYPHWRIGERVYGGLHLDVRNTAVKHTWIGLPDGTYVAPSFHLINQLFRLA